MAPGLCCALLRYLEGHRWEGSRAQRVSAGGAARRARGAAGCASAFAVRAKNRVRPDARAREELTQEQEAHASAPQPAPPRVRVVNSCHVRPRRWAPGSPGARGVACLASHTRPSQRRARASPEKSEKERGGDTRGTAGGMHAAREAVVEAAALSGSRRLTECASAREAARPRERASTRAPPALSLRRGSLRLRPWPRPRQSCARLHPPPSVIPASRALAHPLACARVGPALALCALRRDALPDLSGRLRALHADILLHALLCALRVEGARAARGGQVGVRVDAHLHTCRHRRRGWVAPQSGGAPGGRCTRPVARAPRTPPPDLSPAPAPRPHTDPPSRGEPTTKRLTGHHPARPPVSEPTANLKIPNTGSRRPFGEPALVAAREKGRDKGEASERLVRSHARARARAARSELSRGL